MSRAPRPPIYWAGDVVVIGAGIVGALTARELSARGVRCTLVEPDGFGAAQSNHSHGYLHRGYIYLRAETALVEKLIRADAAWRRLLDRLAVAPTIPTSNLCFTDPINAMAAVDSWTQSKLRVTPSETPDGFDPGEVPFAYLTEESSYDFTDIFRGVVSELDGVRRVRGAARRLRRPGAEIVGVEVETPEGTVVLKSHFYVVAAGVENPRLMRTATRYRGRALTRTSYMLVLSSPHLPPASVIFPENEAYGLFLISRPHGTENVWLVSNFLSYAGTEQTEAAQALWITSTFRTLTRVAPIVRTGGLRCGIYAAPKMELRSDPRQLGLHAMESYGIDNVVAAAPTKITLAPLLASDVADAATDYLSKRSSRGPTIDEYPGNDSIEVLPERWRSVPLDGVDEFLGAHGVAEEAVSGPSAMPAAAPGL